MKTPHFYAIIIGSEILNGRRHDKHFDFIRDALLARGHTLFSTFIIKDDPNLIRAVFTLIKNDPEAVLFSFGGIGSTPDDLTRALASEVFDDGHLIAHPQFYDDIIARYADKAFPHRIFMSHLPKKAHLLPNVVNNMSGFYLENRYFFMPGFPEMAHPMVTYALGHFYPVAPQTYRMTLRVHESENDLMHIMTRLDPRVDFSSLPMLNHGNPYVDISVASMDERLCQESFNLFVEDLTQRGIGFEVLEETILP
jgi:molybdopterin-biosynthesis enzyme MoeA-like protein